MYWPHYVEQRLDVTKKLQHENVNVAKNKTESQNLVDNAKKKWKEKMLMNYKDIKKLFLNNFHKQLKQNTNKKQNCEQDDLQMKWKNVIDES